MNKLFYGDNLGIMRRMPAASADLIYLDPPFKSNQTYNLVYKTMTGKPVPEQAEAFCDTWDMDAEKERIASSMPVLMREKGIDDYYVEFWRLWMRALRHTQPHLLAYLIYMVERLLEMKSILRPTGSIYLHCDPTASHYIKVMMDGIFGHANFQNEIIWKRTSAHSSAKRYGPVHDVILFYSKSDKFRWNPQYQPHDPAYLASHYKNVNAEGRRYTLSDLTAAGVRHGSSGEKWRGFDPTGKGNHWKFTIENLETLEKAGRIYWSKKEGSWPRYIRYLDEVEGTPLQDIWTDISPLNAKATERLGYPTQKPIELMRRIIESSSNHGDVIFDPFCGCGTTVYAAQEAGRNWIGCDIAILAIKLIREMLTEKYRLSEGKDFTVDGIPASVEQAQELFKKDPFQFQHWAVERVDAFPTTTKSGDRGIDGRLYFETNRGLKSMVLSVKGGNIRPTDVRDLRGVLEREDDAEMAGFISLNDPTKAMWEEASRAGVYEYSGRPYRRIQLLTIRDVVEGRKQFDTPTKVGSRISTGQTTLPI